jgi:hypothetical protein
MRCAPAVEGDTQIPRLRTSVRSSGPTTGPGGLHLNIGRWPERQARHHRQVFTIVSGVPWLTWHARTDFGCTDAAASHIVTGSMEHGAILAGIDLPVHVLGASQSSAGPFMDRLAGKAKAPAAPTAP